MASKVAPTAGKRSMSKERYARVLPPLRDALLSAQTRLQKAKPFGLAIIVTGLPSAGRSEIVNEFLEWLDPKHIRVHALDQESKLEAQRWPPLWRYWNTLPARGEIAIYFMGWYDDLIQPALHTPNKAARRRVRTIERITQLERMLPRDRVRVLKLHLTVNKKTQRERLAQLRASKLTRWRVTREDRWLAKHHDKVGKVMRACLRATDTEASPWQVIDGTDPQSRSFAAGNALLSELTDGFRFAERPAAAHRWPATKVAKAAPLASQPPVDSLQDQDYQLELERLQGRLALLVRKRQFARHGAVFAFEGMDAAGKGGAIRRLTGALDARQYHVVPVSAPAPEELAHPYLWRFWRHVPARGQIAIFDRSWYGRVLVERVRDLTPRVDWERAYDEIKEFELQLAEHGLVVHKFWLSVTKDEQLRRFKQRDNDPLKRYKVDPEDWANRRFLEAYDLAARQMIQRTHAEHAPWTVVPADDKKYARLAVLRTVCESIERALG